MRLIKDKRGSAKAKLSWSFFPHGKKGLELVWWTVMVIVIAIVALLLFIYFIRSGFFQIEGLTGPIFEAPGHFAKNATVTNIT